MLPNARFLMNQFLVILGFRSYLNGMKYFFNIFCVRFDWILCVVETIVIYFEAIVKKPEGV